ncbi:putative transmembrane protein [Anaeramoeba flamelloides]|uniref:Transmembrane protein n=1 Tax=Anaeramoeba flamelloides TaxID=1746091 RepID=A0AAV7Z034_9EUKA|nr:putative transmembrane protein [Anaeramoeba flamelloides]
MTNYGKKQSKKIQSQTSELKNKLLEKTSSAINEKKKKMDSLVEKTNLFQSQPEMHEITESEHSGGSNYLEMSSSDQEMKTLIKESNFDEYIKRAEDHWMSHFPHTETDPKEYLPYLSVKPQNYKSNNHDFSLGTVRFFQFANGLKKFLILITCLSMVNLLLNYYSKKRNVDNCPAENTDTGSFTILRTTIGNVSGLNLIFQSLIDLIIVLLFYIYNGSVNENTRRLAKKYYQYRDKVTISDRTILVENIPQSIKSVKSITKFFGRFGKIEHVIYPRNYGELFSLAVELKELKAMRNEVFLREQVHGSMIDTKQALGKLLKQLQRFGYFRDLQWYDRSIEEIEGKMEQIVQSQRQFPHFGKALVVFQDLDSCPKCIKKFSVGLYQKVCCFCCLCCLSLGSFGKKKMTVTRAPEPDDIIWENLHFPDSKHTTRKILVWIQLVIVISISIAIISSLSAKEEKSENSVSFGLSLILSAVNSLLVYLISKSVKWAKYSSKTEEEAAVMYYSSLATLVNQFVTIFVIYWKSAHFWENSSHLILYCGFVDSVKAISLTIGKQLFFDWYRKRSAKKKSITLFGLIHGYTPREFELGDLYSEMLEMVNQTLVFCFPFPLISLISLVFVYVLWQVHKWIVLRRRIESHNYTIAIQQRLETFVPGLVFIHSACNVWIVFYINITCDWRLDNFRNVITMIFVFLTLLVTIYISPHSHLLSWLCSCFGKSNSAFSRVVNESSTIIGNWKEYRPPSQILKIIQENNDDDEESDDLENQNNDSDSTSEN